MTTKPDSPRPHELRQVEPESQLMRLVIHLADQHSNYLGFMAPPAWADYANKGGLIAAVQSRSDGVEAVVGLVSFRRGRGRASIAHLVVANEARGKGLARLLVDEVSERTRDLPGILVRSRRDFPANSMWRHLGFFPRGEQLGRGRDPKAISWWWLDHGHTDLFTWDGGSPSRVPVVIDANTFIDLHSSVDGARHQSTEYALREVLDDRIELLVTPELALELDRNNAGEERKRLLGIMQAYPVVPVSAKRLDEARTALSPALDTAPARAQDASDLTHVAYAMAAGLEYVVTRDRGAQRRFGDKALEAGVHVVTPGALVSALTASDEQALYWPAALQGMTFTSLDDSRLAANALTTLNAGHAGERQKDLRKRLENVLLAGSRGQIYAICDASGMPLAGAALEERGGHIVSHALRVRPGLLEDVMARHIVSRVRTAVPSATAFVVECVDPQMPPAVHSALLSQGFVQEGDAYRAVGLGGLRTVDEARVALRARPEVAAAVGSEHPVLGDYVARAADGSGEPSVVSRTLLAAEMALAPLTLVDGDIPVWSIPIRPHFAYELFGVGSELSPRQDALGLSVEHVYYTGSRTLPPAYSRVLWYVSGDWDSVFVGHSIVLESARLPWKEAYRINRRLGVYARDEVRKAAHSSGDVGFIRFGHTKLFGNPVPLARARRAASDLGVTMMLRGPWRLPPGAARAILEVGHDGRT